MLLDYGADYSLKDQEEKTAADYARNIRSYSLREVAKKRIPQND